MKKKSKEINSNEIVKNENKVKLSEKLAIKFKRKWLVTNKNIFNNSHNICCLYCFEYMVIKS